MTADKDFNGAEYVDLERKDRKGKALRWRFRCKNCYYFACEWISDSKQSFGACECSESDHYGHMLEEDHYSCDKFMFGATWSGE